jgi:P-type Ca2+ transporter type 2C
MNLSSFLTRNMVTAKLPASTKHEAIEKIVNTLCGRKGLRTKSEILSAILSREEQLGTAIEAGVAIPHARIENLKEPLLFVATLKSSVDFETQTQDPVDIVFLFITPAAASNTHLKMLSMIGRVVEDASYLDRIRAAKSDAELYSVLSLEEQRQEGFSPLYTKEVFRELDARDIGLTDAEVRERLAIHGKNKLQNIRSGSLLRRFLNNFTNLLALLMWVGAAFAFLSEMPEVAWAIIIVIFINAIFSFWQEFKAERAIEALRGMLPSYTTAVRNGKTVRVLSEELVPGDIIQLEEGDNIAADGRLFETTELRIDNSAFSGESKPVYKVNVRAQNEGQFLWIEIPTLVFAGTSVVSGSGKAVVTATGMNSEIGQIAFLTQTIKVTQSPLQKEIARLTKVIALVAVAMGFVFFLVGTALTKMTFAAAAIFAIGIILGNVPEGLLPTVTLSLAMAVQRMAKRGALIKKLSSVETLGSTNVICTDKTGTLTTNQMSVRHLWIGGRTFTISGADYQPVGDFSDQNGKVDPKSLISPEHLLFFQTAVLCNNSKLNPPTAEQPYWNIVGDPTEGALLVLARKAGMDIDALRSSLPEKKRFPFESIRKRMSSIRSLEDGKDCILVKGAPRELLELCTRILYGGEERELTDAYRTDIFKQIDAFAKDGLRILGFAYRRTDRTAVETLTAEQTEQELVFLGITAMFDPPRPGVAEAIESCKHAGIRVVMVTGDYQLTALSIAEKLHLVTSNDPVVITGSQLSQISDEELRKTLIEREVIFARVSPEYKLKVVTAFKEMGNIVAVTGDGVNDAPALKKADIGVAMGLRGTDVARESAEMILTDDNFASIVHAIEEGRAVFSNIKKFITYIFAHLIPEAVPFILYVLLKIPAPITALQILAIDLGTETLPALALGVEKPEPGVMDHPPRSRKQGIVDKLLLFRGYVYLGLSNTAAVLVGYFVVLVQGGWRLGKTLEPIETVFTNPLHIKATTMIFVGIVVMQIANIFSCRSERLSAFRIGFWSNKLILIGIVFELLFTAVLMYVPFLQGVFTTTPLGLQDWLLLFGMMLVIFLMEEARKKLVNLWRLRRLPRVARAVQG